MRVNHAILVGIVLIDGRKAVFEERIRGQVDAHLSKVFCKPGPFLSVVRAHLFAHTLLPVVFDNVDDVLTRNVSNFVTQNAGQFGLVVA